MKKLLALLLLIPLAGSARMFPTEFPIKAVCWDDVDEAIQYHQEMLVFRIRLRLDHSG